VSINFASLNTAVHGPLRLGVLTSLQSEGTLDFTTLKNRLDAADGAIGIHLQKLEAAGYITATKKFNGRRPNTNYALTADGRTALFEYLETMQRLIDHMELTRTKNTNS
jgi:DNA-binding PadR family transcriptional regulator